MGETEKTACKNCGDPTTFGSNSHYERVKLGWCRACFQQSQRATVDNEAGTKRWWDDQKVAADWPGSKFPGRR